MGSSSGDKQLETRQKSSKFKMRQLPLPPSFHVTIACTLVGYSNLTGSQFSFYIKQFSFFKLNVFFCIWYFFDQISAWVFLIHLFFYAGFDFKTCLRARKAFGPFEKWALGTVPI